MIVRSIAVSLGFVSRTRCVRIVFRKKKKRETLADRKVSFLYRSPAFAPVLASFIRSYLLFIYEKGYFWYPNIACKNSQTRESSPSIHMPAKAGYRYIDRGNTRVYWKYWKSLTWKPAETETRICGRLRSLTITMPSFRAMTLKESSHLNCDLLYNVARRGTSSLLKKVMTSPSCGRISNDASD